MIATPDRRRSTQLCHVNLLKAYYARVPIAGADVATEVKPALFTTLTRMHPQTVPAGVGDEEDVKGPGDGVLRPQLKN